MSGSDDYDIAQKLKRELKKWETEFVTEHKRKPKKEDIDASPQGIQETYRSYNKLKKQIQERIDKKKEFKDEKRDQIRNENQNDEKSHKTDQIRNENQNDEKSHKTDQIRNENQNDEKSPKTDQIRNENKNDEKSPKTDQTRNKNQNDEKSQISAVGKTEKKNKKDSPQDTDNVDDDSVGNESEVWGRQFDRKNVKEKRSTSSETEGKKSNQYLQKLSSKLFDVSKQIGDVKPSYRRSKPLIIPKETCNASKQKSDIYDYSCDDKNSEFKIKNKLFEKAVSLTRKKSALTDTDTEEVILPNKFIVKSKPKSSQGDYQNSFEAGKLDKDYMSTDRNWDEIDHMAPFADESHKSDVQKEAIYDNIQTAKSYKKQDSSPVDIYSKNKNVQEVDIEEPMEIDDDSYNKPSKRRIRKPIIRTKSLSENVDNDDVVVKETGDKTLESKYDFSGEDDVPVIPKHGKRKAEKSQEGQSKKRKVKVIEDRDLGDETNTETEVKEPPKPKKPCAPTRSKAPSSYAKSENFVRLNMKVKTYRRKGSQGKTGPQMKRFLWKQKMKSRSESYGNKCFKCGQEGHWANKCKGGAKEKEEMDDQPPVLEENFPTLRQASMMAKGIKTDGQKDKVKVPKTSKQNEDSKVEEKEKIDDDVDEFDIEAGIVRTTREIQEAPPPMEPFFSLEEENSEDIPDSVKKGLKQFGYDKFRHGQEKAVKRILSGRSTLVILSTGGGKSLTYQLPAILYAQKSNCFTLVISPLVSLMEDQITGLPPGVRGACLHTNMSKAQRESVMQSLKEGQVHFLLVSPEAIAGGAMSFLNSAASLPPISFVCIDETHCLSEWSHNFRPSYLRLTKVIREKFGVQCFLGLTATATQSTAADVAKHLGIDNLEEAVVRGPPVPKNLFLSVSRDENREEALIGILQGDRFSQCESIIVYCTRRQTTDRLATLIRTSLQDKKGENWTGDRTKRKGGKKQYNYWDSESYHAGLSAAARKRVQNAFMSGRLRVVVATVAFGMGLDKSNVRGVIHYNMPKSFESYVQEIGRAGRDGKPSHCHVFLDSENSLLDRDGNDNHGNVKLQSACRQPLLDAMPLLIVTAPSTAASTPGDSHSSIQFINEDVNIIKRTDEDNTVEMSQSDKLDTDTEYNHIKNQNKMDAMNNTDLTNEAEQVATNENGVELDNSIARTHESCEYHQDNKEYIIAPDTSPQTMHSVNIGLTQSDDSLSSHNASYCYGNQVEYAASGWYGNIGYHPPIQMEDNNVEHYHGNSNQCLPRTTENNFKRFCDNGDATSFERDEIQCTMKEKMYSDNVAESRPALKDTHNVISLDQYEQRRKLQRQDRTLTQTMSFESDAF